MAEFVQLPEEKARVAQVIDRTRRALKVIEDAAWVGVGELDIAAWQTPGEPVSFTEATAHDFVTFLPGTWWGRAWETWWFRLRGARPSASPLAVEIDLGFSGDWAGNQAEGMVYLADGTPLKAVQPMNRQLWLPDGSDIDLFVEAAANPNLSHHIGERTEQGDVQTRTEELLYRFNRARLIVRDDQAWQLARDLEVVLGLVEQLDASSTRRARLVSALEEACNRLVWSDVAASTAGARAALVDVLAAGANASAQQMVAVGHAHIDSAWLWPIRETKRKVARTFANVASLMSEYPDFQFAATSAQQYQWAKDDAPAVFEHVCDAVQRGQWHPVGGMWVESDANLPSGESLIRQFVVGGTWFAREFGKVSDCLWLPDSFGYSAQLPQIAALAGMRWFFTQKLSWNRTNTLPHHSFWWEGIDGTRIWTHFPPVDAYDSMMSVDEVKKAEANFRDKGRTRASILPFGYGDGGGGPTREMVERARRMSDLEDAPRVILGSPSDYLEAALPDLAAPVWRGELYLEFHRGVYTSVAAIKRGNRASESALAQLEMLGAWQRLSGAKYPSDSIEAIWRRVLLLQFHDILPGSSIAWVNREAIDEYGRIADETCVVRDAQLSTLAGAERCVINTTPVDRREVIDVDGAFVPVDVPAHTALPLSTARVDVSLVSVTQEDNRIRLDNGVLTCDIDAQGHVTSLIDQRRGRQVVIDGMAANVLRLALDQPSCFDAWELEEHYRATEQIVDDVESISVIESGPLRAQVEIRRRFGASSVVETITCDAGSDTVDFNLDVDWQERERVLKASFPLAVHARESVAEIQFGHLARPISRNTSWQAAQFEIWAHRWLSVQDANYHVALCNSATYGHDVTQVWDGADLGVDVRLTLLRAPQSPDPRADLGRHNIRYSLLAGGDIARARSVGTRLGTPLLVADVAAQSAPVRSLDSRLMVETIKPSFTDDDIVVRVFDASGGGVDADLELGIDIDQVQEVDIYENPVENQTQDLPVGNVMAGRVIPLTLHPFQILTLRLCGPKRSS